VENGIGWSALDVGRLLVPLSILVWNYPEHGPAVRIAIARWRLDRVAVDGLMYGGVPNGTDFRLAQEGRLGYEQYGARAFALVARDVSKAVQVSEWLDWTSVYGVNVPVDARRAELYGAHTFVTSEPYVLGE